MSLSFYGYWYKLKRAAGNSLFDYWRYRANRWYLAITLVFQVALWYFAYRLFTTIGSDLFVSHYNVDFGIDGVGSARRAFIAPIVALAVLFFNSVIIIFLGKREHVYFLSHASGLAMIVTQILAALALMSLYLINFLA